MGTAVNNHHGNKHNYKYVCGGPTGGCQRGPLKGQEGGLMTAPGPALTYC